jgi:hypothetical protein
MTCRTCIAPYPRPARIRGDVSDEQGEVVLVFAHGSREAAEAGAACNREHYGHPSRAELRESVGWVTVVDLRPAIARLA